MESSQGVFTEERIRHWRLGSDHFNQAQYWEAHEAWEWGWKTLPPIEHEWVRAMIQAAAVFYHLQMGRTGPALSLCRRALHWIGEVQKRGGIEPVLPRIEIPYVREEIEWLKSELEAAAVSAPPIPAWLERMSRLRAVLVLNGSQGA